MEDSPESVRAFVFKNRGTLLALPAVLLALTGKPSRASARVGIPLAIAGELLRCWAVGYSGVTTRGDKVEAPELVSAGPYAYVRNPLYVGNFITAAGFAIAFTGGLGPGRRIAAIAASLGVMAGVYATIVPHEEQFLLGEFGHEFDRYRENVPPLLPRTTPWDEGRGAWRPGVIRSAETRTFVTFAAMLAVLAFKTRE
jgi:protein-S-isoprenylcysteine O-methyltransferase Ste14